MSSITASAREPTVTEGDSSSAILCSPGQEFSGVLSNLHRAVRAFTGGLDCQPSRRHTEHSEASQRRCSTVFRCEHACIDYFRVITRSNSCSVFSSWKLATTSSSDRRPIGESILIFLVVYISESVISERQRLEREESKLYNDPSVRQSSVALHSSQELRRHLRR